MTHFLPGTPDRRPTSRRMGIAATLCVAGLALGLAPQVAAAGGALTDQAVTLAYGASHWDGSPEATLQGVEPSQVSDLAETGWWYRVVGLDTREHPFPAPDSETYTGSRLVALWTNVDGKGFDAQEDVYVYDQEGPSGAFTTRLSIRNNTGAELQIHLFHYLDGNVLGTSGEDSGRALTPRFLNFSEGSSILRYSWRSAVHSLVRPAGPTGVAALLNDASADTFDDSGLPIAGDWTAGFQGFMAVPAGAFEGPYPVVVSVNLPRAHSKGGYWTNGNAFPELATREPSPGTQQLNQVMRRVSASEAAGMAHVPNTDPVGLNDFDGDLFDEWVDRDPLSGQVYVDFQPLTGGPVLPLNWKLASTEDLDNDGKADILWRNLTSQKLVVWTMNGPARIGTRIPDPDQAVNANWDVAGVADFNHDSFPDFLWYNQTSGNIVIWHMDSQLERLSGSFTNPASVGNVNWKAVAVGDFGKGAGGVWDATDVVWQNDTTHKVVVWHMDHAGNRTAGVFTVPDNFAPYSQVIGPR